MMGDMADFNIENGIMSDALGDDSGGRVLMTGHDLKRIVKSGKPFIKWDEDCYAYDDGGEAEWEDMTEYLTEVLNAMNPQGKALLAEVENFGWRNQDGFAFVNGKDGEDLLFNILPKTNCNFNIFLEGTRKSGYVLKIQNFHHDSPTGNEIYSIRVANRKSQPKCNID